MKGKWTERDKEMSTEGNKRGKKMRGGVGMKRIEEMRREDIGMKRRQEKESKGKKRDRRAHV